MPSPARVSSQARAWYHAAGTGAAAVARSRAVISCVIVDPSGTASAGENTLREREAVSSMNRTAVTGSSRNEVKRPRRRAGPVSADVLDDRSPEGGSAALADALGQFPGEGADAGEAGGDVRGVQQPADERRADDHAVGEAGDLGGLRAVADPEPEPDRQVPAGPADD